jgi:hypothetical protein
MIFCRSAVITSIAAALIAATASHAMADGRFSNLAGAWHGVGRVQLAEGKNEHLACKAYYTEKDAGTGLGIALQCASAGNKIDLRATLSEKDGTLSGQWEERGFNSTGTVEGGSDGSRLDLKISGTIEAQMSITLEGESQLISISSESSGFKAIDLELLRG